VLFSKRLKNLIESEKKYWRMKLKKISLKGGGERANSTEPCKLELISQIYNPLNSRHMLNQEVKHQTN